VRLQGLERGLAVIQAFTHQTPSMTLSEVARQTHISRATARRILLTLEGLGFVRSDGRQFALSPRVLSLGWAYLSSLNLWDIARPFMQDLSTEVQETCSACTLDLPDIVFVARVPTRRILMMSLGVGSRLPAYATAMGRVLLAGLPDDDVAAHLSRAPLEPLTHRTTTDPERLRAIVGAVREQGFALVDEELELGLRSLSVPLTTMDGRTLAALNLCAATARASVEEMHARHLPAMRRTACAISNAWTAHPAV
jgi:IclR family pca regulon transcriptional regulator